ncbi:MAG TPA: dicarboxylate/amino acid:cation symporter [Burkholderiales bacterium]|nr:dicarboxylate/amino acid:cation symporter [Burkholderiales bacterium]
MIKLLRKYNTILILTSLILAIVFGILTPWIFQHIKFLGDLFLNLLKLFALPLICSALIATLGNMGHNLNALRSLAKGALIYMIISEVIAVTIALVLFNMLNPGYGVDSALILHGETYTPINQGHLNLSEFILSIFPNNIFDSLAKFNLLPVVVFSIIFGTACAISGKKGSPIISFFEASKDVSTICLYGVMSIAPLGIFALVGNGIAESSIRGNLYNNFAALIAFVLVLILGLLIHALWQFVLVLFITKDKPFTTLKQVFPLLSTAFATSSSIASIPIAMETADKLNSNPRVTRFMLPLCASINLGGMMMYEVAAALFFTQVLGIHLSLGYQILLAFACILGGMAEGGIPETSMVSLVVIFKIVNVPLSAISILLPLDRIIDRLRTMVNIFGNLCGVIIVSRFIKEE